MTAFDIVLTVLWWVIGACFGIGTLLALVRMVKGPTIIDRMVASDTILTIIICVLGADMVFNGHTNNLPLMLVLALTAFIASVAVARYVSRQGRRGQEQLSEQDAAERDAAADREASAGTTTGETPR